METGNTFVKKVTDLNKSFEINRTVEINNTGVHDEYKRTGSFSMNSDVIYDRLKKDIPVKDEVNNLVDLKNELPKEEVKTGVRELFDNNLNINMLRNSVRESERNRDINIDTNVQVPVVRNDEREEIIRNNKIRLVNRINDLYSKYKTEFDKGGTASFMDVVNRLRDVHDNNALEDDQIDAKISRLKKAVEVYFEKHATKRKTRKGIRRIEIMEELEAIIYRPESSEFEKKNDDIFSNFLEKTEERRNEPRRIHRQDLETEFDQVRSRLITGSHKEGTGDMCRLREGRDNDYLSEGTSDECMDRFLSEVMNIRASAAMLTPEYIYSHKIETLETMRLIEAFDNIRKIAATPEKENDQLRGVYNNALSKLSKKDRKKFDGIADILHKLRIYYACVISSNGITVNGKDNVIFKMEDYITQNGTDGIFRLSVSEMKLKSRLLKKELLEDIPKNEQLMDTLEYKRHASAEEQRHMTRNSVDTYREDVKQKDQTELNFIKNIDAYHMQYLAVNGHEIDSFEKRRYIARKLALLPLLIPGRKCQSWEDTGKNDMGNIIVKGLLGTPEQLKNLIIYLAKNINTTYQDDLEGQEKQAFYSTLKNTLNSMIHILGEENLSEADKQYIRIGSMADESRKEMLQNFYGNNPLYFLQQKPVTDKKGKLVEDNPVNRSILRAANIYGKFGNSVEDSRKAIAQYYEEYISIILPEETYDERYICFNRDEFKHYMDILHAFPYVNKWIKDHEEDFKDFTLENYLKGKGIVFPIAIKGYNKEITLETILNANSDSFEYLEMLCRRYWIAGVDNYSTDSDIFGRSDEKTGQINDKIIGAKVFLPDENTGKSQHDIRLNALTVINKMNNKHSLIGSDKKYSAKDILSGTVFMKDNVELLDRIEADFLKKYQLKVDMNKVNEYYELTKKRFEQLTEDQKNLLSDMPDIISEKDMEDLRNGKFKMKFLIFYDIDDETVKSVIDSGTDEDKAYLYFFAVARLSEKNQNRGRYGKIMDRMNAEYYEDQKKLNSTGNMHESVSKQTEVRLNCMTGYVGRMINDMKKVLGLVPKEITNPVEQVLFAMKLFACFPSVQMHHYLKNNFVDPKEEHICMGKRYSSYTNIMTGNNAANFAIYACSVESMKKELLELLGIAKEDQDQMLKNVNTAFDNSDIGKIFTDYYKWGLNHFFNIKIE